MKPNKKSNHNQKHSGSGSHSRGGLLVNFNPFKEWRSYYIPLFIILVVSVVAYLPLLHNEFVNWDDDGYIYENMMIHHINLGQLFSTYVEGNYHPLTMLTYAVEYHLFGLNAGAYHAVSLLLHLLNVILVFYVILLLSNKMEVALVASLLFGVHPLHVESVAWASELKDLLYAFFFLASYFVYLIYIKNEKGKLYFYSLLLFLLALFSKGMAASLPLLLVLTDYFMGRKMNSKVWLEKIPFFVLALIFGIVAVRAQKSVNAIDVSSFTLAQRLIFACYGFIIYLYKLVLPLQLSSFYPYPVKDKEAIPGIYYAFPLLVIGLTIAVLFTLKYSKKILFGIGFFAITIVLVLQVLALGQAIIAERYVYLPSIGIFYLIAELFYILWKKNQLALKVGSSVVLGIALIFFSVKTYARCEVWKDSITLWTDVISKYPQVSGAWNSRAAIYIDQKKYDEALRDFNKAIEVKPDYSSAYNNRAALYVRLRRNDEAIADIAKAIELKPDYFEAYDNRGMIFKTEKRYEDALSDFERSIEINPKYAVAYNHKGSVLVAMLRNDEALAAFNKAIELNPEYDEAVKNRERLVKGETANNDAMNSYNKAIAANPTDSAYYKRGLLLARSNKPDEALGDLDKTIKMNSRFYQAYYDRANIMMSKGNDPEALNDFQKVIELNPSFYQAYNDCGVIFSRQKKYDDAKTNYDKAIKLKSDYAEAYMNRALMFNDSKRYDDAISDFNKTIQLKPNSPDGYYGRARAEYSSGKKDAACADLQRAVQMKFAPAEDAYSHICH